MELFHIDEDHLSCCVKTLSELPEKGYLWLILERSESFDLVGWLKKFGKKLNPRHLEDSRQLNHPSAYDGMSDYDILIYRTYSDRTENLRHQFDSTTYIIFDRLLITLYDASNVRFLKIKDVLFEPGRPIPIDTASLTEFFINYYVDRSLELKALLDDRLALWQKKLLQAHAASPDWKGLLDFKNNIRRLKGLSEEQLDTINAWRAHLRLNAQSSAVGPRRDDQLQINLTDVAEHAARVGKLLTQAQQELESLMQLHFTILSHRTNEIMRILALVTGIFLPANLITGIFGMNFTHMPDLETPHGFFFVISAMVAISCILLIFFRWRKWI